MKGYVPFQTHPTLLEKHYIVAYLVKSIVSISISPVFRESSDRSEEL
jgi:hypothetical protein